jgi:nucleotide-binding universal stress UspA family protein
MSYKTILIHATADETGQRAINVAKGVAAMFKASLLGVAAECSDLPVYGDVTGELITAEHEQVIADLTSAKKSFQIRTTDCVGQARCVVSSEFPLDAMARHARGADLVVACRPPSHANASFHCDPTRLVMETGLPLLLAPGGTAELAAEHVVVAWRDRREAIRAVSDALPFLMKAQSVHVVSVCESDKRDDVMAGLEEVKQRLGRHGVAVETELLGRGANVLAELEVVANRRRADLIVAGAYSHSRVREWVLGGVTQDMLGGSSKFLLLSR